MRKEKEKRVPRRGEKLVARLSRSKDREPSDDPLSRDD